MRSEVVPVRLEITGGADTTLWLLFVTVALILLIACANVANLMLARAAAHLRASRADEALADRAQAHRAWREARELAVPIAGRAEATPSARYWACVSLWEAAIGLGDVAAERRWARRVRSGSVSASALATREARSERLRGLVAELNLKLPSASTA